MSLALVSLSSVRSIPRDPPTRKFSVTDITLPDHLHLRVVKPDDLTLANWPAYKFGVETMLRAYGLEEHLSDRALDLRRTQVSSEQWKAEEDLFKAIIGFNVKDFTKIFGSSPLSQQSAEVIWTWLSGLNKAEAWPGMELSELECTHQ